jgi:hypothetical protein
MRPAPAKRKKRTVVLDARSLQALRASMCPSDHTPMPTRDPRLEYGHASTSSLDPVRIVYTLQQLHLRIEERFPESGLGRLAGSLLEIGEVTKARLDDIARPIPWLRSATWLMATVVVIAVAAAVRAVLLELPAGVENAFVALQVLESGIQDVVFIGIALAFLITAENRLRRRRALTFIRELRAIAHIVDMHQLTKDPDKLLKPARDTEHSPRRNYTTQELGRYLDYCSELLSLTSKLAALYAERFSDEVILQAVDEVETLTNGLSRKVWQKIMILEAAEGGA